MHGHHSDAQAASVMPQGLIGNFREVNDDTQTGVAFSFDLLLANFRDINNRDKVQLQWQTTNGSKGVVNLSVRKGSTTESVRRYQFTVNPTQLPEGTLNLTLSLKLQCLLYSSSSCSLYQNRNNPSCTCRQWQYQGNSETILMSAKRGMKSNVHAGNRFCIIHAYLHPSYSCHACYATAIIGDTSCPPPPPPPECTYNNISRIVVEFAECMHYRLWSFVKHIIHCLCI